jgi:hypothetical protein
MQQYDASPDLNDTRVIWRKLFTDTILRADIQRPQFWVIDALDECVDASKLFPILSQMESNYSIRICITSRFLPEYEVHFPRLGRRVLVNTISIKDTSKDIRLFLEKNADTLPIEDGVRKTYLIQKLVTKSAGCFLWARLVLRELQSVYSEDLIETVIDELPTEMSFLYQHILDEMPRHVREARLAKAMLRWAVCAVRSLQTVELVSAIQIDEGVSVRNQEKSVIALCGQILQIDNSGCVQVMHMTTRTFLTDECLDSEFAISVEEGNRRIALTCLKYLSGEEMRPPRSRAVLEVKRGARIPFAGYACLYFSDHLVLASCADDTLLFALEKFLKSNVLTWIEYLARSKRNLYHLTKTAKNLEMYLGQRAKIPSLPGASYRYIVQWVIDLSRLVARFGSNLLDCPEAIYYLIPSICPRGSTINANFANTHSGLNVIGLRNGAWEDCISHIELREDRSMSVAVGDNAFAIGTKFGRILLYWQSTCQERMTLEHREIVKVLAIDNRHQLASAGPRMIKLWNLKSEAMLWMHAIKEEPILLQFSPDNDFLIEATRRSHAITRSCDDGTIFREQSFSNRF